MGGGIRPKGSFPYATLRHKGLKPPCLGDESKVPDKELCFRCVHTVDCYYAKKAALGGDNAID